MVEKYRGVLPPGSVWFRLSKDEALALLRHQGELEKMTPEQVSTVDSAEIQAVPGKVSELEEMLQKAGLSVVTLHD